ncbi:TRAP transporter small permease [Aerococcus urinaeequi]|uniref:TRAP transporter small permease n=1 Tax=Aerococcus viridans TaxID=1377 RepID=A0A2N6UCV1_9LACT|nr:TRAP transporter small permease [Aerococcus viridans]PMC79366.1 TRAP transporter small permease [Aerococcus viridans]
MKQLRNIIDKAMRSLCAVAMAALTLLVIWQVFTRYILNHPSTWSEELAAYMFAWVTVFGAAYVFGKREHMNIPVIVERFSSVHQNSLQILAEILNLIFALTVMVYGGFEITKLTMGQLSSSLPLQMGYFYMCIPISGIFIALYSVLNIKDLIDARKNIVEEED